MLGFPSIINNKKLQNMKLELLAFSILSFLCYYKYSMRNIILIHMFMKALFIHLTQCQIIFSDNFEQYGVAPSGFLALNYNNTWFRKDVAVSTGKYKIKGSHGNIMSAYLAVFGYGIPTINCINVTMAIGAVYQLSFSHSWETLINSTLYCKLNDVVIFSALENRPQGVYQTYTSNLPAATLTQNTICFSGAHSTTTSSFLGPIIDNVVVTLKSMGSQISSNNSVVSSTNLTNSINSSNLNITNSNRNQSNLFNISNGSINSTFNNNTSNLTSNSTSNLTSNTSVNISQPISQQNSKILLQKQPINIKWVNQVGLYFNSMLKYFNIFGFGYLINNLLNFWNIIILYYFLNMQSIIKIYRKQLEQLCYISLSEGSLLKLLSQLFNRDLSINSNYNIQIQRIPKSQSQWSSFFQMGLTSQVLPNNYQEYFAMLLCLIKLFIINFIAFICRKFNNCVSAIFYGVKIKNINIFCYQVITSAPTLIIPVAVMCSRFSNSSKLSFNQNLNIIFLFSTIPFILVVILSPLMFKQKMPHLHKPQQTQVRSTIFVSSQVNSIQQIPNKQNTSVKQATTNVTTNLTMKTKTNVLYSKRISNYNKQLRYHNYLYYIGIIETIDHTLFFTIPFLIGLQCNQIFLLVNFIIIVWNLSLLVRKGYLIRQFDCKQFWFGLAIKILILSIHIIYILFHFHQTQLVKLQKAEQQFLSFLSLFLVVAGAIVQTFHSIINIGKWIYQIIKKIKFQTKQNKVDLGQQAFRIPPKKTLQIIHARKDTEAALNKLQQFKEMSVVGGNDGLASKRSIKSIKSTTYRKLGHRTQRISTIFLDMIPKDDKIVSQMPQMQTKQVKKLNEIQIDVLDSQPSQRNKNQNHKNSQPKQVEKRVVFAQHKELCQSQYSQILQN